MRDCLLCLFFFFNDTATTEIYTLSLHDALPIYPGQPASVHRTFPPGRKRCLPTNTASAAPSRSESTGQAWCPASQRSEEHTSELQSRQYLVCRLLLEKKTNNHNNPTRPRNMITN